MVVNVGDALAAYRQSPGAMSAGKASATESGGGSFADALKSFATDAVGTMKEGEEAAAAAATGKADLASTVASINSAEMMLTQVVSIRDKIIAAYQEISRTAI